MKRLSILPTTWPVSVKIPLVVALLMFAVSALVTERVLTRLSATQDQHLRELSGAYLDGLSSAVLPHVLRGDIWEAFDALDRAKKLYRKVNVISTVVTGADGVVIAASDPRKYKSGSLLPPDMADAAIDEAQLSIRKGDSEILLYRDISFQDRKIGRLTVSVNVANQLAERKNVTWTLILGNTGLTLLMAIFGYFMTRRMTRPMQVLAEHLDRSREGGFEEVDAALVARSNRETARMFSSYNAMVKGAQERDKLAATLFEEEKLASLGRLASAMAHEINNPLGGMLNTVSTMKAHPDNPVVFRTSVGLLERGLKNIAEVVRTALVSYRDRGRKRPLLQTDFSDLHHLLRPETRRRRQELEWNVDWTGELPVDGIGARQICLNLLLNASAAAGDGGNLTLTSTIRNRQLEIVVENDGKTMPPDLLDTLNRSGAGRLPLEDISGLGLWVVSRIVDDMNGRLHAESGASRSTVTIRLPFSSEAGSHAA